VLRRTLVLFNLTQQSIKIFTIVNLLFYKKAKQSLKVEELPAGKGSCDASKVE
jgi:hypothetical protein